MFLDSGLVSATIRIDGESAIFQPLGQPAVRAERRELRAFYEVIRDVPGFREICNEQVTVVAQFGERVWVIPQFTPGLAEFYAWSAPCLIGSMCRAPVVETLPPEWITPWNPVPFAQVQPETTIPLGWYSAGRAWRRLYSYPLFLDPWIDLMDEDDFMLVVDREGVGAWYNVLHDSPKLYGVACDRIIRICYLPYRAFPYRRLYLACFGEYALLYPEMASNLELLLDAWGWDRLFMERRVHIAHATWLPPEWRRWWPGRFPPARKSCFKYGRTTFRSHLPVAWQRDVESGVRMLRPLLENRMVWEP